MWEWGRNREKIWARTNETDQKPGVGPFKEVSQLFELKVTGAPCVSSGATEKEEKRQIAKSSA